MSVSTVIEDVEDDVEFVSVSVHYMSLPSFLFRLTGAVVWM